MKINIFSIIYTMIIFPIALFSEPINIPLNSDIVKLNIENQSVWIAYATNLNGQLRLGISDLYYHAIITNNILSLIELSDDEVSNGNYKYALGHWYSYDEQDAYAKKYLQNIFDGLQINPDEGFVSVSSNNFGSKPQFYFGLIKNNQFKRLDFQYKGASLGSSPFGEPGFGLFYDKEWNCVFFGANEISNYQRISSGIYRYDISENKMEKLYDTGSGIRAVSMARLPNTEYLMFCADIEMKDQGDIYLLRLKQPTNLNKINNALFDKLHNEGFALYKQHKDAEAVLKYEEALKYGESAQLWYDYGNSLSNLKNRLEDSLKAYQKAVDLGFDKKHLALYNMACVESKLGKLKEAYYNLTLAVQAGYNSFKQIEKDSDLMNLRADKDWPQYFADIKAGKLDEWMEKAKP